MKNTFFLFILLALASCGGSGGGNSPTVLPLVGEDPCIESGACTDQFEVTSADVFQRRVRNSRGSDEPIFKIGRTYELEKTELLNSYDAKSDKLVGNCPVSYTEKRILFKVDINYSGSEDDGDKYIYKYEISKFKSLDGSDSCTKYIEEKHADLKNGKGFRDLTVTEEVMDDLTEDQRTQVREYLKKYKIIVLKYKGRIVTRIETRGLIDDKSYFYSWSSDGGYVEKTISTKTRSITMRFLDDSFLSDFFITSSSTAGPETIESNSVLLKDTYDSEIDLSELPRHYRD